MMRNVSIERALQIDRVYTDYPWKTTHHWEIMSTRSLVEPIFFRGRLRITSILDPNILSRLQDASSFVLDSHSTPDCEDDEEENSLFPFEYHTISPDRPFSQLNGSSVFEKDAPPSLPSFSQNRQYSPAVSSPVRSNVNSNLLSLPTAPSENPSAVSMTGAFFAIFCSIVWSAAYHSFRNSLLSQSKYQCLVDDG